MLYKRNILRKNLSSFLLIIGLILSLPLFIQFNNQAKKYISRATSKKGSIVVDVQKVQKPLNKFWQAFAQGGEEKEFMLRFITAEVKKLQPQYIRIDHIFDFYDVVQKNSGQTEYNFNKLDKIVSDILKVGAKPFFSLSYMPSSLSMDGSITSQPLFCQEWESLVKATVNHYSSSSGLDLKDLYYEVWNEPDLFGNWKTYGEKDYRQLYLHTVKAVENSDNLNNFFIGGPTITTPYKNWLTEFLKFVSKNNLRLDFISWHRYDSDPTQYEKDILAVNEYLRAFPEFEHIKKIISEWAFDSEYNQAFDNQIAAAHEIATLSMLAKDITYAFTFELKDGVSYEEITPSGKWGLMTHEKFGKIVKPRYEVLLLMNRLGNELLSINAEGDYVYAIATKNVDRYQLIAANYDQAANNIENLPLTFVNLPKGKYTILIETLSARKFNLEKEVLLNEPLQEQVLLLPNDVAFIEVVPI